MMLRRGWLMPRILTWGSYPILLINVMQLCRSSSCRSLAQGRTHLHLTRPVQGPLVWAFYLPWCSLIVLRSIYSNFQWSSPEYPRQCGTQSAGRLGAGVKTARRPVLQSTTSW
ncbi:hypothetical protein E4T43_05433 [Aureobasidium subglaciale]|nr:hypothetical protein E4T43_05433 [Aureobasidium subglaciale]